MTTTILYWNYDKNNNFGIVSRRDLSAANIDELFRAFTALNENLRYTYGVYSFNDPRMTADYLKFQFRQIDLSK